MPLKPHPTDPDKIMYESGKYVLPKREWIGLKDEPVAWGMKKDGVILDVICPQEHEREEGEYNIPLYTHPKEWVWLTDKEVDECLQGLPTQTIDVYARRIETKIKDKNNG